MKRACKVAIAILTVLLLWREGNAATEYIDRLSFQAAAPGLSVEGFETFFPDSTSVAFPGFTVAHDRPPVLSYFTDFTSEGSAALFLGRISRSVDRDVYFWHTH